MNLADTSMATHAHDFVGPFLGKAFLIIVDAHSKWPEVIPMMTQLQRRLL